MTKQLKNTFYKKDMLTQDFLNLFNETKKILVNHIKIIMPDYRFITLEDMKNKAIKLLPYNESCYAIILYNLVFNISDNRIYEYKLLQEVYNELSISK